MHVNKALGIFERVEFDEAKAFRHTRVPVTNDCCILRRCSETCIDHVGECRHKCAKLFGIDIRVQSEQDHISRWLRHRRAALTPARGFSHSRLLRHARRGR